MFGNLGTFIHDAGEELDDTSLSSEHLSKLEERFEFYFPIEEDPRKENGCVQNPFISIKGDLPVVIDNKLLELAADEGLNQASKMIINHFHLFGY